MKLDVNSRMVNLGDSDLNLADEAEDIRGRKVVDRNQEEVGKVSELLVDESEKRVRFFVMKSGGVLGIGAKEFTVPVDAISSVTDDAVYLGQSHDHLSGSPDYDPRLADDRYWEGVYEYYGYSPFWTAGYTYPRYSRSRGTKA